MKSIVFSLLMIAAICTLPNKRSAAQNEVDAIRYSLQQTPGTARTLGMGGAFGAVGADAGSIFINPGGAGLFRRGELQFGLGFNQAFVDAETNGVIGRDQRFRTTVNNFSYVKSKLGNSDWYFVNYGIAYARTNQFHQRVRVESDNVDSGLLDVFRDQAQGNHFDSLASFYPFTADLAWWTYGIDTVQGFTSNYAVPGRPARQSKTIDRSGFTAETSLFLATNYRDKFFIGASVGIVRAQYSEVGVLREEYGSNDNIRSMEFRDSLVASGFGLNLRIGAVARVGQRLRLGLALQTSTNLSFDEQYETQMSTVFINDQFSAVSPLNSNGYTIRIPARYSVSAAYMLGDHGVVSGDYQVTDYSTIRMRSIAEFSSYDYNLENNTISTIYRLAHQARAGVEWRLADVWRARAGFIYTQSPFVSGTAINTPIVSYTAGAGYRYKGFFADLATVFTQRTETYFLYDPAYTDATRLNQTWFRVFLAAGFRL
jgi:hypothetical protein